MVALLQEAKNSHTSCLSEAQIKSLSRRTISEKDIEPCKADLENQNQSTLTCGVCLMDYSVGDLVISLPCSHVFHDACIVPWLTTNDKCPL
ncbi:hypothetical protein J3B02_006347, partial [Coemansia erecta]